MKFSACKKKLVICKDLGQRVCDGMLVVEIKIDNYLLALDFYGWQINTCHLLVPKLYVRLISYAYAYLYRYKVLHYHHYHL